MRAPRAPEAAGSEHAAGREPPWLPRVGGWLKPAEVEAPPKPFITVLGLVRVSEGGAFALGYIIII